MLSPDLSDAARWHDGMQWAVLVLGETTGGRIAACHVRIPGGTASSVHRHEREDEIVHVLAGHVDVWCRSEHRRLAAGETMLLARGVPHRLATHPGADAEALVAYVPGGVEATLVAASTAAAGEVLAADDLAALLAGAGISLLHWERPPLLEG